MRMTERVNAFTLYDEIAKRRDEAIDALKMKDGRYGTQLLRESICRKIQDLAKELPKDKALWYGSKDMQSFRLKIDEIAEMLKMTNIEFARKDLNFQIELNKKESALREKMTGYYAQIKRGDGYSDEQTQDRTKPKEIGCIERLRYDYKRRLGNIVLNKVRYVQTHTFVYDRTKKYKTNDKALKTKIAVSERAVGKSLDRFFGSFVTLFSQEQNSHRSRLQEIEQEIKDGYDNEQRKATAWEENHIAKEKAKAEAEEAARAARSYYSDYQKG